MAFTTVNFTWDVTELETPYTWKVISDTECVSFTESTGVTSDNFVEITVNYDNTTCSIEGTVLTFFITDNRGCVGSVTTTLVDSCTAYNISLSEVAPFTVLVVHDNIPNLPLTYEWEVNGFEEVSTSVTGPLASLVPTGDTLTPSVTVISTDANGCTATETTSFSITPPSVNTMQVVFDLCPGETVSADVMSSIILGDNALGEIVFDFSNTSGTIEQTGVSTFNYTLLSEGTDVITYYVTDEFGVSSLNYGTVIFTSINSTCAVEIPPTETTILTPVIRQFECGETFVSFNANDLYVNTSGVPLDPTSLFIKFPCIDVQTCTTSLGELVYNPVTQIFTYTPSSPTGTDVFTIIAASINGVVSQEALLTFILEPCMCPLNAGEDSSAQVCQSDNTILFDLISGSPDINGIWSELTSSGITLPTTYNGVFDFTGITTGIYQFQYTLNNGNCTEESIITIEVLEKSNAGLSSSIEYCNNGGVINLTTEYQALNTTVLGNGVWTIESGSLSPGSNFNGIDELNLSGLNGVYYFRYTTGSGMCSQFSIFTLIIRNIDVSITSEAISCNNNVIFTHPLTGQQNQALIEPRQNSNIIDVKVNCVSSNDCGATKVTTITGSSNFNYQWANTSFGNQKLSDGGFIRTFTVIDSITETTTVIDINPNLSPTNINFDCNTPSCCGSGTGIVDPSHLIFDSSNPSQMEDALNMVTANAMCNIFGITNTNYFITWRIDSAGTISLIGKIHHNPTIQWITIPFQGSLFDLQWNIDGSTPTNLNVQRRLGINPQPEFTCVFPTTCGDLTLSSFLNGGLQSLGKINFNLTTFKNIVLQNNNYALLNGTLVENNTCFQIELSTLVTGNCNTPVYKWFYDDGNGEILLSFTGTGIIVSDPGTYRVEIECEGMCVSTNSITL